MTSGTATRTPSTGWPTNTHASFVRARSRQLLPSRRNTIKRRVSREGGVEQLSPVERRKPLCRKMPELNRRFRVFAPHTLASSVDHSPGGVAGHNRHVMLREEERIFTGSTIELQDMRPRFDRVEQHFPDGFTLGTAHRGVGKHVIVLCGQAVEREYRLVFDGNGHASTSETVESRPARACSILWRRLAALSEFAASLPARRASCTSSRSSLSA